MRGIKLDLNKLTKVFIVADDLNIYIYIYIHKEKQTNGDRN